MDKNLIYYALIACLLPTGLAAQLSEYIDCSDILYETRDSKAALTAKEEQALLDDTFYVKVADVTKCEKQSSGGAGGGGGGGGGGGAGGAAAGGGGGTSGGAGAAGTSGGTAASISNNELLTGEESIAVTNAMFPDAASEGGGETIAGSYDNLKNGRAHESLDEADNKAALRIQIKAQADAESDPAIKKLLMEQYEALK